MPNGCVMILRCPGSLAARLLSAARPHQPVRHAGHLRVSGSRACQRRDPAARQQGPPGQDRLPAQASCRAASNEVRRKYANFTYQAASWTKPRRVIAKVEWQPGEPYPRVGFIATNLSRPVERVFRPVSMARALPPNQSPSIKGVPFCL